MKKAGCYRRCHKRSNFAFPIVNLTLSGLVAVHQITQIRSLLLSSFDGCRASRMLSVKDLSVKVTMYLHDVRSFEILPPS